MENLLRRRTKYFNGKGNDFGPDQSVIDKLCLEVFIATSVVPLKSPDSSCLRLVDSEADSLPVATMASSTYAFNLVQALDMSFYT